MGANVSRENSTRQRYPQKSHSLKISKNKDASLSEDAFSFPFGPPPFSVQHSNHVHLVDLVRHHYVPDNARKDSMNSVCFDDDDDEDEDEEFLSSSRTSIGSEDNSLINTDYLKADDKKYKKNSSDSSFFHYKKESDLDNTSRNSPRPFWSYNYSDEKEYERQLRQHYVLKHVFNGNLHLPISLDKPVTILDSSCGAGFWTFDMAKSYPKSKIICLDTFPPSETKLNGNSSILSGYNIVHKHGDLSSPISLPDDYLDVVFQRDTGMIIPSERWSALFGEYLRVLKPGGYVELVEYSFNIKDAGPVINLINEWYKSASESVGIDASDNMVLNTRLEAAGFEDVKKRVVSVPIGEWPSDEAGKEIGFLYKQLIKALFKSMKAWWIYEIGVSEDEYEKVISEAMKEFETERCSIDWFVYTAKKPSP